MRKLTDAQADAEHIAANLSHLVTYAETRTHGPDWDAAVSALRLALHCLSPVLGAPITNEQNLAA